MDESSLKKQHKWQQLNNNSQKSQQRSMLSRDSFKYQKFTPNKHHSKSPQKLQLETLKDKTTSMKYFTERVNRGGDSKTLGNQQKSFQTILKRINSIDRQASSYNIQQKNKGKWSNIIDLKLQKNVQFSREQSQIDKKSSGGKLSNLNNRAAFTERNNQQKLIKPNELLRDRNQEILNQSKQQMLKLNNPIQHKQNASVSIQHIFQDYVTWLKVLEENINFQRTEVMRLLQEKHRQFLKVKQQIYKKFAKKQKQIINPELRMLIQEYMPKKQTQKNSLTRVTSDKIFNRLPDHIRQDRGSLVDNSNKIYTDRVQKKQNCQTVRSKANSIVKQNFDTIFHTLNQMKKGLNEYGIDFKTTNKKISSQFILQQTCNQKATSKKDTNINSLGLKTLKAERKSMKKSTIIKDDENSQKRVRLSQCFQASQVNKL